MLGHVDLRRPDAEEVRYAQHLEVLLNGGAPDWFVRTMKPDKKVGRPELSEWQKRLVADYMAIMTRRAEPALPPVGQEPTEQDELPFDPVDEEEG